MIVNINGTTYEFIKKFLAFNIPAHGQNIVKEQEEYIKKLLEKNSNMYVFNDGLYFIVCQEIEEAKYTDIVDNKLLENPNEKI